MSHPPAAVRRRREHSRDLTGLRWLEADVLRVVWDNCDVTVRDVYERLRASRRIAYAAVMSVLRSLAADMNRYEAELECRRYAGESGQAMSYLLGKREVQRVAALYARRRGGSLRAFHDELLSWGCLPPAVIAWGMGLAPPPPAARVSS